MNKHLTRNLIKEHEAEGFKYNTLILVISILVLLYWSIASLQEVTS